MAQYKQGNIWGNLHLSKHLLVVTTNNVITKNGLVMGAGSAFDAKRMFPKLPFYLANKIGESGLDYYFITVIVDEIELGALQTKRHWRSKSPIDLIDLSIKALSSYAIKHYDLRIDCIMPGIGFGGLEYDTSKIITDQCPDNVVFWRR